MDILELKNTITEIKNSIDGFSSRINWKTDQQKISSLKQKREKRMGDTEKKADIDIIKISNIQIIEVQKARRDRKWDRNNI